MPHLMWKCGCTEALRAAAGIRLPRDTAEERLLVTTIAKGEARAQACVFDDAQYTAGVKELIEDEVDNAIVEEVVAVVACDAGAKDGSVSIATASDRGEVGTSLRLLEAMAADGELWALVHVICCVAEVAVEKQPVGLVIYIYTDNLAAYHVIRRSRIPTYRYGQWKVAKDAEVLAKANGCEIRV
eukprot:8230086-Heterocapsa_arctica.AAC.1